MVEECEPVDDFDTCHEVDLDQVEYWQDTLPDPDWRDIEESKHEGFDYDIYIDPLELNFGVVPTMDDQGYYDDEDHFNAVYSELVGVDIEQHDIAIFVAPDDTVNPNYSRRGLFLNEKNG